MMKKERRERVMSTSTKNKDTGLHNSLVYILQHWQLYVFFLLPALALTIIFRYIPMGGILIAFERYNPGKRVGGIQTLYAFPVLPGLPELSGQHIETERLRYAVGFSRSDPAGIPAEPD